MNFLNIAFIFLYFLTFGLFVHINYLRAFRVAKILQKLLVNYKHYMIFTNLIVTCKTFFWVIFINMNSTSTV